MADLYLQAMMHGLVSFKKKDKFDEAIEKNIVAYVNTLTFEEEGNEPQLLSPKMKRARLIEELKEEIKMPELEEFLYGAFSFIKNDGTRYLDDSKFETLSSEFHRALKILEEMDPSKEIPAVLQKLLEISEGTIDAIYEIAIGAFGEGRNNECLAVFVLLTTLDQTNSEYWFRMGIAAQKCGNMDLALRVYPLCIDIDPNLMGAHLFSAECHLILGNRESALNELAEAKKIKEISEVDPIWLDFLAAMENREEIRT
jgi:tetratricopeptide (TPR) repeat protein